MRKKAPKMRPAHPPWPPKTHFFGWGGWVLSYQGQKPPITLGFVATYPPRPPPGASGGEGGGPPAPPDQKSAKRKNTRVFFLWVEKILFWWYVQILKIFNHDPRDRGSSGWN